MNVFIVISFAPWAPELISARMRFFHRGWDVALTQLPPPPPPPPDLPVCRTAPVCSCVCARERETASGGGGSRLNPSSLLATEWFGAGQGMGAGRTVAGEEQSPPGLER